jgi:hypothetical protein
MTLRRTREHLKVQILETERLLQGIADHPGMRFAFEERLEELKQQLDEIPINAKEPSVTILFSGSPVWGSAGIDATFISKVILPFQKMVHADFIQRGLRKAADRGQLKSADDAQLFLTALPKGSFGVELSRIEEGSLFNEDLISDSLANVSRLIASSAKSDEDFAGELEHSSQRVINGLRQFLKIVADDDAGVTIESGSIRASLQPTEVKSAYTRVTETATEQKEEQIKGVLKGILLESRKFDFVDTEGRMITGTLTSELSEEDAANLISSFFNKECWGIFQKTTISLKGGRIKDAFILNNIMAHPRP